MKLRISLLLLVLLLCTTMQTVLAQSSSLSFNGTSDYVEVVNPNLPLGNSSRTVEFWVKSNHNSTSDQIIFTYGAFTQSQTFGAYILSQNGHLATFGYGQDFGTPFFLLDNVWHHVAITYNGTEVTVVFDGVSTASLELALITAQSSLRFGANGPFISFVGLLDEFRIWNYVRTQTQIHQNMYANLSGAETGLVGYWRFNEGSGATAYNDVPNGANGTIYGATWSTDVPQAVRVLRPNGGEIFRSGTVDTLRWIGFNTGAIRIDLNRTYPPGSWVSLFDSVANTGFIPWLVTGETSTAPRIRITTLAEPILSDTSDANFTIQYPEPAAPGNLAITTLGENANLTWARVDTNIYGQVITVERYLVFFRAEESYGWNFLASTMGANSTQYTHATVVTHSRQMFYQVRAWIGDTDSFTRIVREFSIGTPEGEVLHRLGGQISRPVAKKVE